MVKLEFKMIQYLEKVTVPSFKTGYQLTCPRDSYSWLYSGARLRTNCPRCGNSLVIHPKPAKEKDRPETSKTRRES